MTVLQSLTETPGIWTLDPARSTLRFSNKTFWGLVNVKGEFTDVSGQGEIAPNGAVSGHLEVPVASLRTGIGKRDHHLRSADFFDADAHPTLRVVVTGAEPTDTDAVDLRAEITVRGTTAPLPLTAALDRVGDDAVRVTAQTTVDRTRFGVGGTQLGMLPVTTTLTADLVFTQ